LELKLKTRIVLLFVFVLLLSTGFSSVSAKVNIATISATSSDSLMVEFSLFWEAYKTKDYKFAYDHGWNVINDNPTNYLQYKPFKKMEDIIIFLRDSVATTEQDKNMYADTMIALYDKAVQYDSKNSDYFIIKKAYTIEVWKNAPTDEAIAAYEYALEKYPDAPSFYKDRLGILYSQNDDGENGYKLKALQLYSKLAEEDPENDTWNTRLKSLADNPEELADIMKRSWELDKENLSKAYAYAETCLNYQFYTRSIEPLEFLTKKSTDVINYWRKLALVYNKLNKSDASINAYKTLIELEPNNRDNYFNVALIYKDLGQLSVARSYLQKASNASSEPWDLPIFVEASLYEQAARDCGFEFDDKCVYQLAVDTYAKAAKLNGSQSGAARDRIKALSNSVPQQEDYFFRKLSSGTEIKIQGKCYNWINKSIIVP
jgi:tetratricopeptide (TPR) repeat protein